MVQTKFMIAHKGCQEPTPMTKNLSHWSKRSKASDWVDLRRWVKSLRWVGMVAVSGMPWECQLFFFLILSLKRAPNKSKGWAFGGLKFTLLVKRDVICLLLMPFAWFRTIVFGNSDKFQLQSSCRRMRRIDENWNNKSSITKNTALSRDVEKEKWVLFLFFVGDFISRFRILTLFLSTTGQVRILNRLQFTHFARKVSSQGIKGNRERT